MSDRDALVERLQAGRRRAQAEGRAAGGQPPFGWSRRRGKVQPVEREQAVIRLILLMRRNGGSYQAIQAELNRLGIPGPGRSGAGPHGRWTSHERVRQIILRAENGTWPPLPAEHDPNQLQLDQAVTGT